MELKERKRGGRKTMSWKQRVHHALRNFDITDVRDTDRRRTMLTVISGKKN